MPYYRDVGAFDARAEGYESGWRGRLHQDIADKVLDMALSVSPDAERVLDVGCGTGYLLRRLALKAPEATELVGVDPAPLMIRTARSLSSDDRLSFRKAIAEQLPFEDATFDLVLATTSFDHWADQPAGVAEVARVLEPGGHFVVADLLSALLVPTVLVGRRGKVRTIGRAVAMLSSAGLQVTARRNIAFVISALAAMK